jgi:hypothetical protein
MTQMDKPTKCKIGECCRGEDLTNDRAVWAVVFDDGDLDPLPVCQKCLGWLLENHATHELHVIYKLRRNYG